MNIQQVFTSFTSANGVSEKVCPCSSEFCPLPLLLSVCPFSNREEWLSHSGTHFTLNFGLLIFFNYSNVVIFKLKPSYSFYLRQSR